MNLVAIAAVVIALGACIASGIALWRLDAAWTMPRPHRIFRHVKREDRARYAHDMHQTFAIQERDLNRAFNRTAREIGKALLPVFQQIGVSWAEIIKAFEEEHK
jgi:hypothetical protein